MARSIALCHRLCAGILLWCLAAAVSCATLEASPSHVSQDRQNVTLTWAGVAAPSTADWVGVFSPALSNLTFRAPVKLRMCSDADSHLRTGAGSVVFSLLNMRDDYVFALFRSGVELALDSHYVGPYAAAAATSNVVTLSAELKDTPSGIHLALTDRPDEMVVMWTTNSVGQPVVQYGETPQDRAGISGTEATAKRLPFVAKADTTTYTAHDLCPGGPADSVGFMSPGMIHRAVLANLRPHTNYSYRVGDASRGGIFSSEFVFTSAGADAANAVRLLVLADMGTNEAGWDGATNGGHPVGDNVMTVPMARAILQQVTENAPPDPSQSCDSDPWWCGRPTLVVHPGDLSYAVGFAAEWEEWMQQITYAAHAPLMVQVGNHERNWRHPQHSTASSAAPIPGLFDWGGINSTSSGGECGIPTETRFSMPGWPWGSHVPGVWGSVDRTAGTYDDAPWYGFEFGPVYVYMASSEHDLARGSPQYAHMAAALAAVDRTRTPWVVVTAHRAMYLSSDDTSLPDGDQPIAEWMRSGGMEELFVKHRVNLGLYGHFHAYQRSCRVINGTCVGTAADNRVHAPIHIVVGTAGTGLDQRSRVAPYTEYTNFNEWGYGRIFANSTTLTWQFVQLSDGQIADYVTLTL